MFSIPYDFLFTACNSKLMTLILVSKVIQCSHVPTVLLKEVKAKMEKPVRLVK
jgi:hypothetical protein